MQMWPGVRKILICSALGITVSLPQFTLTAASESTSAERDPCPQIEPSVYKGSAGGRAYRCALLEQLTARGLDLSSPVGQQILSELYRPHDTLLEFDGEAALPQPAVLYLFEEFPQTAQLLNFYNGSNYQVAYTRPDRAQFFATNSRNMQATVDVIYRAAMENGNNYILFENGQAKLMLWHFAGKSIVELNLLKYKEQTKYEVRIHLFSNSGVFHAFFESPLFAYLVKSIFKKIAGDIVRAVEQFAEAKDAPAVLDSSFTTSLLKRLK